MICIKLDYDFSNNFIFINILQGTHFSTRTKPFREIAMQTHTRTHIEDIDGQTQRAFDTSNS